MSSKSTICISLCIIAKDGAKHLPLTLSSAHQLVDEIILVDLGSNDGTQRIAREFDARVVDFHDEDNITLAWQKARDQAQGKWILQLDPGYELVLEDLPQIHQLLNTDQSVGYLLPEYSLDNQDDFYYRSCLYRNSPDVLHNPLLDDSFPNFSVFLRDQSGGNNNIGFLPNIKLFLRFKELKEIKLALKINKLKKVLEDTPQDYRSYYYLACYYKELGQNINSQEAIQQGIKVMTELNIDEMLNASEASGLFGFFADQLVRLNISNINTINSLVPLQRSLPVNIRLNTPLAVLLHNTGRTREAVRLLNEAIHFSFRPNETTLSYYESFVNPVFHLLDIVRQTGKEKDLLKVILNIQSLAAKNGFPIRPVFTYLNEFHPDFLNLIDGLLKRKLVEQSK